jgi:REP element-mobilizing transposase RayT
MIPNTLPATELQHAPPRPHRTPGLPHHSTQRGNRREAIVCEDADHKVYRDLLAEQARKAGVEV